MKKQLLLILITLLPMLAWADESGKCGDNLTWTYYESTHSLVITGSGDMYNYSEWNGSEYISNAPWKKYSYYMVSVTLMGEVTNISEQAFRECSSLASVSIPVVLPRPPVLLLRQRNGAVAVRRAVCPADGQALP